MSKKAAQKTNIQSANTTTGLDEKIEVVDMSTLDEDGNPTLEEAENETAEVEYLEPEEEINQKMAEQEDKIRELKDKHIRTMAEFDNYKRRSAQEFQNRLKFANQNLVMNIIPGLDNLERALEHAQESGNEQLKEFVTGVEMVQQQFLEAFKNNHIKRNFPVGEPFDPNQHEAMGVFETNEYEPDQIVKVYQAGYIFHERTIRPAMVQVAKAKK